MPTYFGIYGVGDQDEKGNRLELYMWGSLLMRDRLENGNYDVSIMTNDGISFHLLEDITLREWREFFVEHANKEDMLKLEESARESELAIFAEG